MKQDFLIELIQDPNTSLAHHGIIGQKWGVRRYQNPDGSLTEEGRRRYQKIVDRYDSNPSRLRAKKAQKAKELLEKDKAISEREKQEKESINNYAKALEKSGWEVYFDNRPIALSATAETDGHFGDNKITFVADYYAKNTSNTSPEKASKNADFDKKRYEKEYKKVLSTTTEQLAKDYYDSGSFHEWHSDMNISKWTRDDFKSEVSKLLNVVDLKVDSKTPGGAELWFNDGEHLTNLFGYHSLSVEYNIDEDKAYRSSFNG